MFTLYGAFPFAQMHDISIIVGYNLKFDVLRVFEVFFDTEGSLKATCASAVAIL